MKRLVLVLLLLLGGCTPTLHADVTRFNSLATPAGLSFTIVPDQAQVGSLEFQDYASQVGNALAAHGWRPVAPGGPADALVSVHWGVGPGELVTWESPSSVYSGVGWGPRTHWYGAGVGWYGYPYWDTYVATYYPRWLSVQIVDAKAGRRNALFEGRAVALGTQREIAPAMPYLVQALFTGFPGTNGSTVRVDVPMGQ